jgi:biotin-(acetyl-CoA carboxylase) ligase
VALVQTEGTGSAPSWRIETYKVVGSTNEMVAERARTGEPEGLVVVADHQERGRGRLGRTWRDEGLMALLASVLFDLSLDGGPGWPTEAFWLGAAVGLSALFACEDLGGSGVSLKWPNDLVADLPAGSSSQLPPGQGKLAGILSELVRRPFERLMLSGGEGSADGPMALVVGMGLNLAWLEPPSGQSAGTERSFAGERGFAGDPSARPVTLQELTASSAPPEEQELSALSASTKEQELVASSAPANKGVPSIDRETVLARWLSHLGKLYMLARQEAGRRELRSMYQARCSTLGNLVRVELTEGSVLHGEALSLTDDGALVVRQLVTQMEAKGRARPGSVIEVRAGDVVHLRSWEGDDPANLMQS